jgi:transposase
VFVFNVDNAAIHHTQEVIGAINATLVVFLPPYSPDFMPCEELFLQVKHYLRENDIACHNCSDTELMVFDLVRRGN